ncbi:MAG: DUF5663 domain-containing protein [Syntrophobacteraceae bacterium]|jgi:DNA-directed RNA polymerase specialized sigma24 family protein
MSDQKTETLEKQAPSAPTRNPYIMNFCKTLVEKKGEQHQPEDLKKLLGDMYRLFESMLGQNMVNALPEDLRKKYLEMAEDLSNLNYEKIGAIFDTNVKNYHQVMKDTMKQFAEIYLKNRQFSPEHYPVKLQSE